jgi:RNA polymerase sigma-70 factor (ECF subfamily)
LAAQGFPVALTADKAHTKTAQPADAWLEPVFREHWTRIYSVIYRLVGDDAEAEDLALETFWRLYRRPPSLKEGQGFGGWLYRVATNLGFNALRARGRRQRYEEAASTLDLGDDLPGDPATELERTQERRKVRAILEQMKPRSAQVLILRYSGLSYAEVAVALGVSPASVGTLLARAEEEFENRYQGQEEGGV